MSANKMLVGAFYQENARHNYNGFYNVLLYALF